METKQAPATQWWVLKIRKNQAGSKFQVDSNSTDKLKALPQGSGEGGPGEVEI